MALPRLKLERDRVLQLIFPVALLALWSVFIFLFAPSGAKETKQIVIKPGSSTAQIARQLHEEGIIGSPLGFRLLVRLEGVGGKLKAGNYRFSGEMSPREIVKRLAEGRVDTVSITIPEGYNTKQIAALVEKKGIGKAKSFLEKVANPDEDMRALVDLPEGKSLEGFLFPDTYNIGPGEGEDVLIKLMLKRFAQIVPAALVGSPLSHYETVVLASLIEKEAKLQKERPLISAVFHNRLKKGMRLQSCATVAYVLNKNQAKLSYEDLKVESEYNTYLHAGLPPEPICNPGLASIQAAAKPADVDYLYFFAKGDGTHHFSRTYQEHLDAQKP